MLCNYVHTVLCQLWSEKLLFVVVSGDCRDSELVKGLVMELLDSQPQQDTCIPPFKAQGTSHYRRDGKNGGVGGREWYKTVTSRHNSHCTLEPVAAIITLTRSGQDWARQQSVTEGGGAGEVHHSSLYKRIYIYLIVDGRGRDNFFSCTVISKVPTLL